MDNNSYKQWHKPQQNAFNDSGSLKKGQTHQGYYRVENPEKYIGDPQLVIYRSAWEYSFCRWCDMSQSVKKWSSEPVQVPYYDRVSKLEECAKLGLNPNDRSNWEVKQYNTDFWFEVDKGDGVTDKIFVEIKPAKKLKKPLPPLQDAPLKEQKNFNAAAKEYLINEAKFAAMKEWAEKNGCKFYVFTEDVLSNITGRFWHEKPPRTNKF
jgi:hypothetical protein